jgi:predicted nucleic acid-binding protein
MLVVDATVLVDLLAGMEEQKSSAARLLEEDPVWISVSLWRLEVGNALRTLTRTRSSSLAGSDALALMREAECLVMETVEIPDGNIVLELALSSGLTTYDASYVWLARERGIILRTRDAELLQACPDVARRMP